MAKDRLQEIQVFVQHTGHGGLIFQFFIQLLKDPTAFGNGLDPKVALVKSCFIHNHSVVISVVQDIAKITQKNKISDLVTTLVFSFQRPFSFYGPQCLEGEVVLPWWVHMHLLEL